MAESHKLPQMTSEQSSSHEILKLKDQLKQAVESKRVHENQCVVFQREIQELKEQLNMFASASQLGVFASASQLGGFASSHTASIPSQDDPMAVSRVEGTPTPDDLIASLKSELERCLCSNRQKSAEILEKIEVICVYKDQLEDIHKITVRMDEYDTAMQNVNERIQTLETEQAKLNEVAANMSGQIFQIRIMHELEKRFWGNHFPITDKLKYEQNSTQSKFDNVKLLYIKSCVREAGLKMNIRRLLDNKVGKIICLQQKVKTDWESLMNEMKAQDEFKNSLGRTTESELPEENQSNVEMMVSQAKLVCLKEQQLNTQALVEEFLNDVNQLLQENEKDGDL